MDDVEGPAIGRWTREEGSCKQPPLTFDLDNGAVVVYGASEIVCHAGSDRLQASCGGRACSPEGCCRQALIGVDKLGPVSVVVAHH